MHEAVGPWSTHPRRDDGSSCLSGLISFTPYSLRDRLINNTAAKTRMRRAPTYTPRGLTADEELYRTKQQRYADQQRASWPTDRLNPSNAASIQPIPSPATAFYSSLSPSSRSALSIFRLRQLYVYVSRFEAWLVWLLRSLSIGLRMTLWPPLVQPLDPATVSAEEERREEQLYETSQGKATNKDGDRKQASSNTDGAIIGRQPVWSAKLLHSAAGSIFPNGWHPLSFRKTILIDPSLQQPPLPSSSTSHEWTLCCALVTLILLLNAHYLQ